MKPRTVLVYFLLFIGSATLAAQSVSEKRNFSKTLPVKKGASLEVTNKYGTINITTWNKDSAYILAEVEAFAPNQSKLNKMFDGIEIDITGTDPVIRARTEFNQGLTSLMEGFKKLTDEILDYDSRVQINYYISIPEYLDIRIENQFGDVIMENTTGELSISVTNGEFKASSVNRITNLTLNFSDATINSVKSAKINASFSEVVIGGSDDLSINSTSSRYDLKNVKTLKLESRRDKFFIDEVSSLEGTSYFTDYKIASLGKSISLTAKYGSLGADKINNEFQFIDLVSSYSDVTLAFDQPVSYSFEIRALNAFVVIPEKNTESEKEVLDEARKEYLTSGTFGNNPGTRKVKIGATRGNIYIK